MREGSFVWLPGDLFAEESADKRQGKWKGPGFLYSGNKGWRERKQSMGYKQMGGTNYPATNGDNKEAGSRTGSQQNIDLYNRTFLKGVVASDRCSTLRSSLRSALIQTLES